MGVSVHHTKTSTKLEANIVAHLIRHPIKTTDYKYAKKNVTFLQLNPKED